MQIINQAVTLDEVAALKAYFQRNFDKKYLNYQDGDRIIDHRLLIDPEAPEYDIIRSVIAKHFPDPLRHWSAYQRQTNPHHIHIDDYFQDSGKHRYTYVIAMDTVPEFKTIVWKERCRNNEEFGEFMHRWSKLGRLRPRVSNISATEDLEHTIDPGQGLYLADWLTLDGVFSYQAGSACLFDATQLHCTSNWVKYNRWPYRELLQIHVATDSELELAAQ